MQKSLQKKFFISLYENNRPKLYFQYKSFEQKLINVYGPSINQINSETEES